jgi:hypothetical protein
MPGEDLMRSLLGEGADTPSSALAFVANDNPEDEKIAKDVMRNTSGAMGIVNKWRQEAKEATRYYNGDQWPDLDRMRMEQLRRPALVFNEIQCKVDAVSGIERMNRSEARFVSRSVDSDITHDAEGDLASDAVSAAQDMCDGEKEDSRAILDCVISGMGWVEVRMDYTSELDGRVVNQRIDNMEMVWDGKASQENLADSKWRARIRNFNRKDFKKRWPDKVSLIDQNAVYYEEDSVNKYELVTPYYSVANEKANPTIDIQPTAALTNIPVIQYQWIDYDPVYRIADPQNPEQLTTLTEDQWEALQKKNDLSGTLAPKAVRQLQGVYKQVYVALGVVLEEPITLPMGFSLICITGQWDANRKIFYGLVRRLRDPQNTMNKAISALVTQYITNAKSGIIFKTGTFADVSMAKSQWAQPDAWIEANDSANLSQDILPRTPTKMSDLPPMLFQESRTATSRISGISDEMIGLQAAEQTGPVVDKRVQGGLAILGWLWDNVHRFKKEESRCLLEFIREYWSHGQLIRVGGDFNAKAIPLLRTALPLDYELVLDQSVKYNPNLKAQIWDNLLKIAGPLLKVPAGQQILLKGLKFSPFPAQVSAEIQQAVSEAPPQQQKGRGKQEDPTITQAKVQKMGAESQRALAQARKLDQEGGFHIAKLATDAITHTMDLKHKSEEGNKKLLASRIQAARAAVGGVAQESAPPAP